MQAWSIPPLKYLVAPAWLPAVASPPSPPVATVARACPIAGVDEARRVGMPSARHDAEEGDSQEQ